MLRYNRRRSISIDPGLDNPSASGVSVRPRALLDPMVGKTYLGWDMHYIPLLIDKSAFQQLTTREAKWLFHHFRVNFPPVFFAEVIADLTKARPTTASADGDVQMLARKIVSYALDTNAESFHLVRSELHGAQVPMKGVTIEERAEEIISDDGRKGLFVDQAPTQDMIDRWAAGDFSQLERDQARVWREGIANFKLEEVFREIKKSKANNFSTHAEVGRFVDDSLLAAGNDFNLMTGAAIAYGVPTRVVRGMIAAWKRHGSPPFSEFFPYAHFCLRLELYFLTGISHQVISTRDSNRIDIEYFKYLPFTRVFCSADALHIDGYEQFAQPHNVFVPGTEMKQALAEIADYWENLPEEERKTGTASYADYPPVALNNAVTQVYDKIILDWRQHAAKPRTKITPEMNDKIMAHLKPMMDAIEKQRKR